MQRTTAAFIKFELLRQTGGKAECNLFRAMGLDYVFQPEGNHTDALIETFQQVKDCDHPVVVHIVTEKGRATPGRDPQGELALVYALRP